MSTYNDREQGSYSHAVGGDNHNNPFWHLLYDLEKYHDDTVYKHPNDTVYGESEDRYKITPFEFVEIKKTESTSIKKMAFVDGGNYTLEQSPNYIIALNRVYYTIFKGPKKMPAKHVRQRTTFLSCLVPHVVDDAASDNNVQNPKKLLKSDTRLYEFDDHYHNNNHNGENGVFSFASSLEYLPDKDDLLQLTVDDGKSIMIKDTTSLISLCRKIAEIRLATKVVEDDLDAGDMLVMDGSLQTSFGLLGRYADKLYDKAIDKQVLICGLAKTSRLITESGDSLLSRVSEISKDVPYNRWYVPVAKRIYHDSRGFTLCVKLHPNSKFVFRLDILNEQFEKMTDGEKNDMLTSLASNSNDLMVLGYPYGAIEADKHAKVRASEAAMCGRILQSKRAGNKKWQDIAKNANSIRFHDLLNKVTG